MDRWSLLKVAAREREWHKDNKDSNGKVQVNDELWAVILTQDFFNVQCSDVICLITTKPILWLQTATCERASTYQVLSLLAFGG